MSNKQMPAGFVGKSFSTGCLYGLGMAVGFFVISGLVFLLIGPLGLETNIRMLVAVASGPILGTGILFLIALTLTRRINDRSGDADLP
nr:hypothetical protein [Anaerolineae bacterium]